MSEWVNAFGQQHRAGQEEASRLPFIVSTFNNQSGPVGGLAVQKKVNLQGGEQVQVSGYADIQVKGSATTAATSPQTATMRLRLTYPGGTVTTVTSQAPQAGRMSVRVDHAGNSSNSNTTVTVRSCVPFSWPIEPRFQTGGEHLFSLHTAGDGTLEGALMTILVV